MECSCGSAITASSLATFLVTSTAFLVLLALRDRRQRTERESALSQKLDAMNDELIVALQGRRLLADGATADPEHDPKWLLGGDISGPDAVFSQSATSGRGLQQALSGLRQEVAESHATVSQKVDDLAKAFHTSARDSQITESQGALILPDGEGQLEEDGINIQITTRYRKEHGAAQSIQRHWRGHLTRAELTADRELTVESELPGEEEQDEAEISERAALATELYALREQDPMWSGILQREALVNRSEDVNDDDLVGLSLPAESGDPPGRQEHVGYRLQIEEQERHGFRSCDVDWCFQKENTRDLQPISAVNMTAEEVVHNHGGLKQSARI